VTQSTQRPNIVFIFADDWGRYANAYAKFEGPDSINALIETPNFNRVVDEGAIFTNAHVPVPSCTPCRSSILSGTYFWETGLGAILEGGRWDESIPTYPLILEEKGYHIGYTYKVWSPGIAEDAPHGGYRAKYEPSGNKWREFSIEATKLVPEMGVEAAKEVLYDETRSNFASFLEDVPEGDPFCYWWGPVNTHRVWEKGSGKDLWGLDPDKLKGKMPDFLPDVHEIREDFNDYLGEAQAVDAGIGIILEELDNIGELDNTLIVISGDHGIPGFPRSKANLYDIGTQVTLAARWPQNIQPGKVIHEFVNLMNLAPTFLEAAGETPPDQMVESLLPLMTASTSGESSPGSGYVITGRERHVALSQQDGKPYPSRAIRTQDYLYIRNFAPDRWPSGHPGELIDPNIVDPEKMAELGAFRGMRSSVYHDLDGGPTKEWLLTNRSKPDVKPKFDLCFGKRPAEELYDLKSDPDYLINVAGDPEYSETVKELSSKLLKTLQDRNDPRLEGENCKFEHPPFAGPVEAKWYEERYSQIEDRKRRARANSSKHLKSQ